MTSRRADWSKRTAKKTAGTTVALNDTVVVPVTADRAWSQLEDVPLVASCLPGLDPTTLRADGDNAYRATMVNTVMGISANWDLRATINPVPAERVLHVVLDGADTRLNMKLDGVAEVSVRSGSGSEAQLDYTANLRVEGSLAAMGGPVIKSILADAIEQFVAVVGGQEPPVETSRLARFRARLAAIWLRLRGRRAEAAAS